VSVRLSIGLFALLVTLSAWGMFDNESFDTQSFSADSFDLGSESTFDCTSPPTTVIAQTPNAGAIITPADSIDLYLRKACRNPLYGPLRGPLTR
jgi:hypothetical protein